MKTIMSALAGTLLLLQATAADVDWTTDVPKAIEKAKADKKLVLLDFTGSDWCGWCIRLDKEVFSQKEFQDYAAKNLVPVKLDFPRKIQQTDELKKANRALQAQYKIEGYPTIVVLNGEGKEVGRLGYEEGGPKNFIKKLEALKGKS